MRWLAILLLVGACTLGTSPEDEARQAQGGEVGGEDDDDGDETHRPGQPCLTCHRAEYSPGDKVFVVAGTVYLRATDADGLEGATIAMTDADGHYFEAKSNRTGNFMVQVDKDLNAPEQKKKGKLKIPWQPKFPLSIEIRFGDAVQEMKSFAWRDGSCAGCHTGTTDEQGSVPKVFLIGDDT